MANEKIFEIEDKIWKETQNSLNKQLTLQHGKF